jgi:hypothetical protein
MSILEHMYVSPLAILAGLGAFAFVSGLALFVSLRERRGRR